METNGRLELAFPTVARINKGMPKEPNTPGKDLKDRLRVTFYPGAEEYRELFIKAHPELKDHPPKPGEMVFVKRLRAMMPFGKVWDSLQIYNEAHSAGRMVFKATDTQVIVRRSPTGEYLVRNGVPYEEHDPLTQKAITYQGKEGKSITLPIRTSIRLRLFIPEMMRMVALELKSTSYYDALNLRQQMGAIQMMADMLNGGVAGGIPFFVFRREQAVTWNKKDGSAARVPQWLINIEVDPQWVAAATARLGNFALTGQVVAGLLQPTVELRGEEDPALGIDDPEEELAEEPQPGEPQLVEPEFEEPPAPVFSEEPVTEGQVREEPNPGPFPGSVQETVIPIEPAPAPENGRPYPPEAMPQKIADRAVHIRTTTSNQENKALRETMKEIIQQQLDGVAADCGQDIPTARVTLLFYLTGYRDMNKMPMELVRAIKAWLHPELQGDSPEYKIDPAAASELVAAYKHAVNKGAK